MVGKKAQPWHHIQHPLISQKPHRKVAFLRIDLHICMRYVSFGEKKKALGKGKKHNDPNHSHQFLGSSR